MGGKGGRLEKTDYVLHGQVEFRLLVSQGVASCAS